MRKRPTGRQDIGGEPHAADRGEHVLLTNFFQNIQHEENDEEDNGEDQGKADAALYG